MDVLILIPYYFPGYRIGGPQKTVMNMIEEYGDNIQFYVLTKNHDLGDANEYNVNIDTWEKVGKANVKYIKDCNYNIISIIKEYTNFEKVYACSLFATSTVDALLLNRFFSKRIELFVAPMGVFSYGAIGIKKFKKKIFFMLGKILGIFNNITWCFSSDIEVEDATRVLGRKYIKKYIITRDIPDKVNFNESKKLIKEYNKNRDCIKIVFVSRISPKKNLEYCIDVLNHSFEGFIYFDIYGVIEDRNYFDKCIKLSYHLPDNIHVTYKGAYHPLDIKDIFKVYDVFLFPTRGENFGHVIYESLSYGCIPIISDQTPWNEIEERQCGYVISLEDIDRYRNCIQKFLYMDIKRLRNMRCRAVDFAQQIYNNCIEMSDYERIFLIGGIKY